MGLFDKFKKKPATPPRPMPRLPMRPGMVQKPDPQAENHFIIIILDQNFLVHFSEQLFRVFERIRIIFITAFLIIGSIVLLPFR